MQSEHTDTAIRNKIDVKRRPDVVVIRLTGGAPYVHRRRMASDAPFLSYGQVETLVGAMLRIDETQEGKLISRFKMLRRISFPPGVNIVRGRFDYDLEATMKCVLAFAMNDGLISLPQAATLITTNWKRINAEITAIVRKLEFRSGRLAHYDGARSPVPLVVEVRGLGYLSKPSLKEEAEDSEPIGMILFDDEARPIGRPDGTSRPVIPPPRLTLDLHAIVTWVVDAITAAGWMTADELKAAVTR